MDDDRITLGAPLVRIAAVKPVEQYLLRVDWEDGRIDTVDLAGVISGFAPFAIFRDNIALFRTAQPIDWGAALGWENGLDFSAARLREIADIQRTAAQLLSAEDFRTWMTDAAMTVPKAAAFLGMGERQIKKYRAGDAPIPKAIALLIRQTHRDKALLHALNC